MRAAIRSLILLVCVAIALSGSAIAQHKLDVRTANAVFEVTVPDNQLQATDAELTTYIQRGATAVIRYFGRFPMDHVNINIRAVDGNRVRFGRTMPTNGGTIMMLIGREATAAALNDDWTLTHEMTHLAFPASKEDNREWIAEGMATYVEPVARAQAGYLTPEYVWGQFVDNMHKGEPKPGDEGIDNTQTWGRVYWGGALFCLVADVEIRRATKNKKGLQDAFRYIMNDKGTMEYEWPMAMIFKEGDQASGTRVLQDLYAAWKDKPVEVDLQKLWHELGVEKKGGTVVFHDDAPLAEIRQAITSASVDKAR
jgi:hypothetical protein